MSLSSPPTLSLSPSLIAANPLNLQAALDMTTQAGATALHIDIMDGHFVPNLTYGPDLIAALRPATDLFLDVHIMVDHPAQWINPLCRHGAHAITLHPESTPDWRTCIETIKAQGVQAGVALNPQTNLDFVAEADWAMIDRLIIMSVNPGFSGQAFLDDTWPKIHQAALLKLAHPHLSITVDGGVNETIIARLAASGIDNAIVGSAFFHQPDPVASYRNLLAHCLETAL